MPETEALRGYRFHPLERRGLVLGLGPAQLATVAAGLVVALAVLRASGGAGGLVVAAAIAGVAATAACWPVAGRTPVGWLPIAGAWVASRGHPARTAPAGAAAPPAGVSLIEAPCAPGDPPLGVVRDRRSATWSAVLPVGSRAFTLLDAEDKRRRLSAWGAVLASMARTGSPVHRLQWVERTTPTAALTEGVPAGIGSGGSGAGEIGPGLPAAVESYQELVGATDGAGRLGHEVLLVVSVHPRRAGRQLRSFGRGDAAVCALLRRELRLLRGQLRSAEVDPGWPLDLSQLSACVRSCVEPAARARPGRGGDATAWPVGWRDTWSSIVVDGRWHATYWVAEWPRRDVGPDFLAPLLLAPTARRVSVTMAPVPSQQAAREVESARTAELADAELRRRAGFVATARHRRQAEGVATREAELADGHAELRFSGYVTVSGSSPAELDAAGAAVETAAHQAGLELRRLYGQQLEAFSWTLPIGRGLA